MLALEGLVVRQGDFTLRADWALPPGARVAVTGPSGAGKSTLLAALGGYVPLEAGTLRWNGVDITDAKPDARDMATLFQDSNLFPALSLARNVGLGLRPALRLNRHEDAQVREVLTKVGLEGLEDRYPGEVSGGQQSRAALARVMLQGKAWFLLDEPFSALGPALRADMLELVGKLLSETGSGLIMVTHAPQEALRVADQIVFVDAGEACPPTDARALMNNPPEALKAYLGSSS